MKMFFSRRADRCQRSGWALHNQELGRNPGVLYKISGQGTDQPDLGG
jgi:hypothetical protein